jgi:hypothetical protein
MVRKSGDRVKGVSKAHLMGDVADC